MPVINNQVIELSLARFWDAPGPNLEFEYGIEFSGIRQVEDFTTRAYKSADPSNLSYGAKSLMVRSLTRVNIEPTANLTHFTYTLRPDTTKDKQQLIVPLGDRDLAIDHEKFSRPYMTTLTYNFKPKTSTNTMVWSPKFQSMLYENSWYKNQLSVFNSKKQVVHHIDAYGQNSKRNEYFKVSKDESYTCVLQVAHHNLDFLKSLYAEVLYVRQKLESNLNLDVVEDLLSVSWGVGEIRV